jgi:hypothetical protein
MWRAFILLTALLLFFVARRQPRHETSGKLRDFSPKESPMNEDTTTSEKNSPTGEKSGGIKAVLITAAFTFLGTLVGIFGKGWSDERVAHETAASQERTEILRSVHELQLEQQKASEEQQLEKQRFEAEMIKAAIAGKEPQDRLDFLEFMVKVNLINDDKIKTGVEAYIQEVQSNPKKAVPRWIPTTETGTSPDGDSRVHSFTLTSPANIPLAALEENIRNQEASGFELYSLSQGTVSGVSCNRMGRGAGFYWDDPCHARRRRALATPGQRDSCSALFG